MPNQRSPVRTLAWVYAALFVFVVALGYLPGVRDEAGLMFGLFKIDPIDDALHLASGLWAGVAAYVSVKQSVIYFRWFGTAYFLDGLVGAFVGKGFLDGALFMDVPGIEDPVTRVMANVPHLLIGGSAMLIGFVLAKKWQPAG